jgi:hypothetical protein
VESFILSAFLAFILYESLAYGKWPVPKNRFPIGQDISISFDERSGDWARRIIRIFLVIVILLCIVLLHNLVFPSDAILRNRVNVILGFLFGPLAAIWINSILAHGANKPLTRGQIIGGIGLVVFFIVGCVGNETGDLISKVARNVSSFKLAGAEVAFSSKKDSTPGAGADRPAGHSGGSRREAVPSGGLSYLSNLNAYFIDRDLQYLTLFGNTDPSLKATLEGVGKFADQVAAPPFSCLLGRQTTTADSLAVNAQLLGFAQTLRRINAFTDGPQREQASVHFIQRALTIASDAIESAPRAEINDYCVPLLKMFCPQHLDSDPKDSTHFTLAESNRPAMLGCIRGLNDGLKKEAPQQAVTAANQRAEETLLQFSQAGELEKRPYLSIARASLMAQLGQYEAADAILYGWLEAKNKTKPRSGWPSPDDWFEVRARSIIAVFSEEWVRRDEEKIDTSVRDEHLANLDFLRKALKQRLIAMDRIAKPRYFSDLLTETNTSSSDQSRPPVFRKPTACGLPILDRHPWSDNDILLWRALFRSYVSMELTYLQNTLHHPEYGDKYAETTTTDLRRFAQLDLSCFPEGDQPDLVYAQILESYARNASKYSALKKGSDEARKRRLDQGISAAKFGIEVIEETAKADKAQQGPSVPFLSRIASSDSIDVQDKLKQDLQDLNAALKAD